MTDPDRSAMTEQDLKEQPDFADEHSSTTFADELAGRPGMEPDESTPSDRGGAGGLDPEAPIE